jgi:hypothetical protein
MVMMDNRKTVTTCGSPSGMPMISYSGSCWYPISFARDGVVKWDISSESAVASPAIRRAWYHYDSRSTKWAVFVCTWKGGSVGKCVRDSRRMRT